MGDVVVDYISSSYLDQHLGAFLFGTLEQKQKNMTGELSEEC